MDLTGDGLKDMLTGQYNPGVITMWENTGSGFKPGVPVKQYDDKYCKRGGIQSLPFTDTRSNDYWNFSSAGFGDFNGDGLIDLFVGGSGGLRVSLNVGTKNKPEFGKRTPLLDIDGNMLTIYELSKKQIKQFLSYGFPCPAGDFKSYIQPVDWDQDGILDLFVTSSYSKKGQNPVEFFRGVMTDKGLRFEKRKALFEAENGQKVFPGSCPFVTVVDYNMDGVMDLLWGLSIPTQMGYEVSDRLAWGWVAELGIEMAGKDPGRYVTYETADEKHKKDRKMYEDMAKKYSNIKIDEKYTRDLTEEEKKELTQRHRGYVYVQYGKKNKNKAIAKTGIKAKDFVLPEYYKISSKDLGGEKSGPVAYKVNLKGDVKSFFTLSVIFDMQEGWYLYADTKANRDKGNIITRVSFEGIPEGIKTFGEMEFPQLKIKDGAEVYMGKGLTYKQSFKTGWKVKPGKYIFNVKIYYQTCDKSGCLPPVEKVVDIPVEIKNRM